MERKLKKGGKVWVRDAEKAWVEGVILGRDKESEEPFYIVVQLGKELKSRGAKTRVIDTRTQCEVRRTKAPLVYARIDDLTQLEALHEPGLIEALEQRYLQDKIYTFSGKVLLAVNPFKNIRNLYGQEEILKYVQAGAGEEMPAHAYGIAARAYRDLLERGGLNQTVLVSGESGAGKTETTKIIMRAISEMSQWRAGGKGYAGDVAERVLGSNPVLEMFGNACTIRNDNSSRFGKMINMKFDRDSGAVLAGSITTYLLEKARLTHQSRNERNFHVFYSMAAGGTEDQIDRWGMGSSLRAFEYITQKENIERPSELPDAWHWGNSVQAMFDLGFAENEMEDIFDTVAGVLHIGNLEFESFGYEQECRIKFDDKTMQSCLAVCRLLQVDADALERALCKRVIRIIGADNRKSDLRNSFSTRQEEAFEKSLNVEEACQARDALAMTLYERLFGWLVWRVNKSIGKHEAPVSPARNGESGSRSPSKRTSGRFGKGKGEETVEIDDEVFNANYMIGLLDVFGFEVFDRNGFEQLMINYCNEQLQRLFNDAVFKKDQYEYDEEGIDWQFIKFPDNQACIDMIESKPIGLLSLMDESCMFPQGNDQSMCNKFYEHLPQRFKRFMPPSREEKAAFCFTIRHFAGDVTYEGEGFSKKNKNELRQEAVDLIRASKNGIVSVLLPYDAKDAAGGADIASYFESQLGKSTEDQTETSSSERVPQSLQQKTVGSHFKAQLKVAIEKIRASSTHYIRCLKPNDANLPALLDRKRLVSQLRYSGVLQLIQVARAGYPYRFTFAEFLQRYAVLGKRGIPYKARRLAEKAALETQKRNVFKIAHQAQLVEGEEYQCGKTLVFLRQFTFTILEVMKEERYFRLACILQRFARVFLWKLQTGRLPRRNARVYLSNGHVQPSSSRGKVSTTFSTRGASKLSVSAPVPPAQKGPSPRSSTSLKASPKSNPGSKSSPVSDHTASKGSAKEFVTKSPRGKQETGRVSSGSGNPVTRSNRSSFAGATRKTSSASSGTTKMVQHHYEDDEEDDLEDDLEPVEVNGSTHVEKQNEKGGRSGMRGRTRMRDSFDEDAQLSENDEDEDQEEEDVSSEEEEEEDVDEVDDLEEEEGENEDEEEDEYSEEEEEYVPPKKADGTKVSGFAAYNKRR